MEPKAKSSHSLAETALQLAKRFEIPKVKLAKLIGISARTLAQKEQNRQPLSQTASDRLYRLAQVIALSEEVFESEQTAKDWLKRPNKALAGAIPLELLDTDAGIKQVTNLLNRIEYGVYS
jgi:putative toxin-antitoxin system antitoxin component (TIGR02293 family)